MEQTRQMIIERAAELLADPTVSELTVADAAARAGVSVRTAYRYFPTKEALLDGIDDWMMRTAGAAPRYPDRLDQLPAMIRALYPSFDEHDAVLRASMRTPHGREARARRKAQQVRNLTKLVENEAPGLDPVQQKRAAGALHAVLSADSYFNLRDAWGLSLDEAIESTLWGIEAIAARLRRKKGGP